MKLFTHFSVIKTIFSYKVNVSRYIEIHEEIGKPFVLTILTFVWISHNLMPKFRSLQVMDDGFRRCFESGCFGGKWFFWLENELGTLREAVSKEELTILS
ncbi:hypothetical protein D0A23_14180 [Bacillus amyloliquefaciens]|nr:hypothetical protein BAMTA208_01570 [Bacillus amyloliquefaciens TA208]RHX68635.1 hypothetical protein D0A23_14180 [Bacillus amyloliquefaciens]